MHVDEIYARLKIKQIKLIQDYNDDVKFKDELSKMEISTIINVINDVIDLFDYEKTNKNFKLHSVLSMPKTISFDKDKDGFVRFILKVLPIEKIKHLSYKENKFIFYIELTNKKEFLLHNFFRNSGKKNS